MRRTEKGLKVFLPLAHWSSLSVTHESSAGLTQFSVVLNAGAGVASMLLEASGKDSARIYLLGKGNQVFIALMSHPG